MDEKKPKVLIIAYGGTITMVVDYEKKSIVPAKNIEELFTNLPNINEYCNVTFHFLSDIDSTNISPYDWTKIINHIVTHKDEYDAFIVTHGTNTMAYTATALSFGLGAGFPKPVILTGSQLPLTVYGNDARFNLENSLKTAFFAIKQNINEVMVCFDDVILRGSRTIKVSESKFRAFDSPALQPIGEIRSTGILFSHHVRKYDSSIPLNIRPHFSSGVLTVELSPGQSPRLVEDILKSGSCKGLVLKSHGAGSVPSTGEYSFIKLIHDAVHLYKIPVLVSTKFAGGNSYKEINDAPAVEAITAGAIQVKDMTDVAVEVKLMWLLANSFMEKDSLKEVILQSFVGEIS